MFTRSALLLGFRPDPETLNHTTLHQIVSPGQGAHNRSYYPYLGPIMSFQAHRKEHVAHMGLLHAI